MWLQTEPEPESQMPAPPQDPVSQLTSIPPQPKESLGWIDVETQLLTLPPQLNDEPRSTSKLPPAPPPTNASGNPLWKLEDESNCIQGQYQPLQDLDKIPKEYRRFVEDGFWSKKKLAQSIGPAIRCPRKGCRRKTALPKYKALIEHWMGRDCYGLMFKETKCQYDQLTHACAIDWMALNTKALETSARRPRIAIQHAWIVKDWLAHSIRREGIPCGCGTYLPNPFAAAMHFFLKKVRGSVWWTCPGRPKNATEAGPVFFQLLTIGLLLEPNYRQISTEEKLENRSDSTEGESQDLDEITPRVVYACRHSGTK